MGQPDREPQPKLTVREISTKDKEILSPVLSETGTTSAFTSFEYLLTYCLKGETKLYLAEFNGQKSVILQTKNGKGKGLRILFQTPSRELISSLQLRFNPNWMTCNLITLEDDKTAPEGVKRHELS